MKQKFTSKSLFYLVLICLPIVLYFIIVVKASINFPIMDDYDAILNFLIVYTDASTFYEKINAVFSQHNEHRIVYTKLLVLGYHKIFGAINFIPLIVIGNLSLVGILLVFYKSLKIESIDNRLIILIPVTLFLFNFQYAELSCWAMTSIQNIGVLLFAFIALYFLLKAENPSMGWAITFATLATYTSGNGILTFVTGLIVLLLKQEPKRKIYLFGGAFVLNLATYFIGLKKVEGHPPFLASFMAHPGDFFLYPLTFIGSLFYSQVTYINFVIGGIVLAIFVVIFVKKIYQRNYILFSFLLFMLFTVGVITLSRFGFGVHQATSSRYAVNSSLIYIILGLIIGEFFYLKINSKIYLTLVVLCAGFLYYSYDTIKTNIIYTKKNEEIIQQIEQGGVAEYNLYYPSEIEAQGVKYLSQASKKDIFKTQSRGFYGTLKIANTVFKIDSSNIKCDIDKFVLINDSVYIVTGWAFIKKLPSDQPTIFIGLEDSLSNLYIEDTQRRLRPDITRAFREDYCDYNMSGFSKNINLSKYPKGDYKLSVLISVDSLYVKLPLNKIINK